MAERESLEWLKARLGATLVAPLKRLGDKRWLARTFVILLRQLPDRSSDSLHSIFCRFRLLPEGAI